jgi:hypothetical protein
MASIRGKIENPISVSANVISEIESPVDVRVSTDVHFNASSLTTFIETETALFLPLDLSNAKNLYVLSNPQSYGNTIFSNLLTEKYLLFSLSGNSSDSNMVISVEPNNDLLYIDKGKKYSLLSSRGETENFGWEPLSNSYKYSHIERTDFDSFDFPQVTISGTRKIPTSTGDTLCGPVTYTGYTYDRLNYNWYFGTNAGITFNPIQSGGTPTSISGSVVSQEGVSSISNKEGSLLFYTNGQTVYTSGNTVMVNGTGLSSSGTSTQSSIIIPRPNTNKYFIFVTDYSGSTNGFQYSIVNMDLQSGNGEIESKNIKLLTTPTTEKVTSCLHSNGEDYWVITHTSGNTNFYSYLVTQSGLSGPVVTSIGSTHNTVRGYMKTSPDGTKLVSLLYDEDIVDIFDFDSSAGTLSNLITLTGFSYNVGPYGLEFSSDSSKIYISEGAGEEIYQFDLSYSSSTKIEENVIKVAELSGASLGALQMGPDEKIYVADYGKDYLHMIHRPNGLGVLCNFEENGFNLTTSGVTGTTSTWGLPNVITNKTLSPDRFVYLINSGRLGYLFNLLVNNVNDVVESKNLSYYGEVYKYNQTNSGFTNSALYNFSLGYENLTGTTGNTIYLPSVNLGEGEFLIKSYWQYNVNTFLAKQQEVRKNNIDTYKRGILYGLYYPETDWYFISLFEAEKPLFDNSVAPAPASIDTLVVQTVFTNSGTTQYVVNGLSDPIVSYNGSVLAKGIEYSANTTASTPYVQLLFTPLDKQILTYAYVDNGTSNNLYGDVYSITSPIVSGSTGTQTTNDRVFYNTTENKYEFYLVSSPASDIVLSINGSILSKGIEYYSSTSNDRRIILEETLNVGDIIEAFYVPNSNIIGLVPTNTPAISWSINSAPISANGKFTIEFADPSDTNFQNIQYSSVTDYVVGEKTYKIFVTLTNASAGDKFIYRIKNEKFYTPIIGEVIYSYSYSDVSSIEIQYNSGSAY